MKILYHGCDWFAVAFRGRISESTRQILRDAKERANKDGAKALESINGVSFHVLTSGAAGGYAFVLDQGETGVKYLIKDNGEPDQWNIFAQARAEHLMAVGLDGVQIAMFEDLKNLGAYITDNAVNRFDYACDFDAPDFVLEPEKIIAHSHTYISRYAENDQFHTQIVGGQIISSMTIGKMPNRQIQIYNKRKEAVSKKKSFWFKAWGRDNKDKRNVWRVEIRLGKKHLKDWNITDLDSFNASFADMLSDAIEKIRYVSKVYKSNPTTSPLSSIWKALGGVVHRKMRKHTTGLSRGEIKQCLKKDRRDMLTAQLGGLACGLFSILKDGAGFPNDKYDELAPTVYNQYMRRILGELLDRGWTDTKKRIEKASRKIIYLDGNNYEFGA